MSEQQAAAVPAGFERLPTGLGYTDTLQPVYRRHQSQWPEFGLVVESQHGNMMGICHGAVLMCLADITAASGVNTAAGKSAGSPTINLSLDFIAAGRLGQWIQSTIDHVTVRRRFGFCSGVISGPDGLLARFNGTFYLPDHDGVWKGPRREADGILGTLPGE